MSYSDLIDEHGAEVVSMAFNLQQHIKDEGIEGVHFMDQARMKMKARKWHTATKQMKQNIPQRP